MFWGAIITSSQIYDVQESPIEEGVVVHLKLVCLLEGKENQRLVLIAELDGKNYNVAVLQKNKCENANIKLCFQANQKLKFKVQGEGKIQIMGSILDEHIYDHGSSQMDEGPDFKDFETFESETNKPDLKNLAYFEKDQELNQIPKLAYFEKGVETVQIQGQQHLAIPNVRQLYKKKN